MPRGRKRSLKFKLKKDSLKSAFAIFLLVLGGLSFFSLLTDNGSVLSLLHDFQADFFGYGSLIFPLILVLIALLLMPFIKWKFVQLRVLAGLFLLLITLSALSSLAFDNSTGGQLGMLVKDILKGAVTVYGAVLVLLACLILSFILIF